MPMTLSIPSRKRSISLRDLDPAQRESAVPARARSPENVAQFPDKL